MKETEVASIVVKYLRSNGWEVYQEVVVGKDACDIVAVNADGDTWCIEAKVSFTISVIRQAYKWRNYADFYSVAVPPIKLKRFNRDRDFAEKICKHFGVGIIYAKGGCSFVSGESFTDKRHDIKDHLREEQKDFCEAGSAKGGQFTEYKGSITKIKALMNDNPEKWYTIKEIVEVLGSLHYRTKNSALQTLRERLRIAEKKWCKAKFEKGKYMFKVRDNE